MLYKNIIYYFQDNKNYTRGNLISIRNYGVQELRFYGKLIAYKDRQGNIKHTNEQGKKLYIKLGA